MYHYVIYGHWDSHLKLSRIKPSITSIFTQNTSCINKSVRSQIWYELHLYRFFSPSTARTDAHISRHLVLWWMALKARKTSQEPTTRTLNQKMVLQIAHMNWTGLSSMLYPCNGTGLTRNGASCCMAFFDVGTICIILFKTDLRAMRSKFLLTIYVSLFHANVFKKNWVKPENFTAL